MMVEIIPPQDTEAFQTMSSIEKSIALKGFLGFLERLTNDTKAYLEEYLKDAADKGEDTADWYVQVKYKDGKSYSPDPKLLEEKFPEKYRAWIIAEQEKFKPKMTKTAFEALWQTVGSSRAEKKASKEKNLEEMKTCMVEHPVKTQYILSSVAEREAWRKAHPIEEADA